MGKYLDLLKDNPEKLHSQGYEKNEINEKRGNAGGLISLNSFISYNSDTKTLPRLPWQLEQLVKAACNGALTLNLRGVPDTTRYVMAWACSYLTSDKEESQKRLWEVYQAWQSAKN